MKKIILLQLILIPILLFSLVSCNKSQKMDYNRAYEGDYEIKYRNYTICGELRREKSGIFYMTVEKPEDVEGLLIISESNNLTITYNNIVLNSEDKRGVESSFAVLLFDVLEKLAYSKDKCKVSKNSISGKTEKGEFKVDITKDGKIEKIVAADGEIEIKFTDFSFDD